MECGKVIGVGNTATVYEWEDDKVVKLFQKGYPKKAVEAEFRNAVEINNMSFGKPKAYEIIVLNERNGIIYDRVEGESLLDWVMKTGDLQQCAVYMAKLHNQILLNSICGVTNYKRFLESNILKALSIDSSKRDEVLQILNKLPEGNTLCHGDLHPGNILIANGNAKIIDFMNVCHGHYLYDVARTVFLVEYTPVPSEVEDKEMMMQLKKTLADLYLIQMNVTREMIQDYLSVITVARLGECPNEVY
jgi:thiamine kinase-like enzyme